MDDPLLPAPRRRPPLDRPVRISILTPVFNEEDTVRACAAEVRRVCTELGPGFEYEHLFADNCSTDRTLGILRQLAAEDPHIKVLAYSRNFGAEKSSFAALCHTTGDVALGIPADMQEPPRMLPVFLQKWAEGYDVVYGTYRNAHEGLFMRGARHLYYWLVDKLSTEPLPHEFSGFALLDRVVIDEVAKTDDFAPYIRGIIATVGFQQIAIPYERQARKAGRSKHGLGFLMGFATNGIITHSMVPIRLATLSGLTLSVLSVLAAVGYAIMKLVNWNFQAPGATTTVVLVLFFSGVQLLFLGMLGEYIGAIHSQVRRKPFVIVRERINFDDPKVASQPAPHPEPNPAMLREEHRQKRMS